jgi:hypothetical protein
LLDSFPRLFAACYVLLRLLVPRHPPLTLSSLDIENPRQNVLAMQFSRCQKAPIPGRECVRWDGTPSQLNSVSESKIPERSQRQARQDRSLFKNRIDSDQLRAYEPLNGGSILLLRKEVIQPHVPVRLPCYDLVPITNPTFGSSLQKGWATDFGCCQLS